MNELMHQREGLPFRNLLAVDTSYRQRRMKQGNPAYFSDAYLGKLENQHADGFDACSPGTPRLPLGTPLQLILDRNRERRPKAGPNVGGRLAEISNQLEVGNRRPHLR